MNEKLLNDQEIETLIISVASAQESFTLEDVELVVDWAERVRIDASLLNGVLGGTMKVSVRDGEVMFGITEKGKKLLEHLPKPDKSVINLAPIQ